MSRGRSSAATGDDHVTAIGKDLQWGDHAFDRLVIRFV